jgi:hypothetical protein
MYNEWKTLPKPETYHPIHESGSAIRALETDYFLPDERTFSDFLKFVNRYARELTFFNAEDKPDGDWQDFFMSDEVFLLADIDSYPLDDIEKERIDIMIAFENQSANEGRLGLIHRLFEITFRLMRTMNDWYLLASRFNPNRESSPLELELTSAIEYTAQGSFLKLKAIRYGALNDDGLYIFDWQDHEFCSLWKKDQPVQVVYLLGLQERGEQLNHLFKQLMMILKPVYDTVSYLLVRARHLMQRSLEERDDHQPHVGLLLAFLQLYRHVQADINKIPERQLQFYFQEVLGMQKKPRNPDRMMLVFEKDSAVSRLRIPRETIILAGQNRAGEPRRYALERELLVSGASIHAIRTLFVSRNQQVDLHSRFQTVTGLYAAEPSAGIGSSSGWSALGEEQRFLGAVERTMQDARVGFAISSPTLRLAGGERTIDFIFRFTESSFHYLTNLLLDISHHRRLKPEEIFHAVFSGSAEVTFTGLEGWEQATDVRFLPPDSWDQRLLTLRIILGKGDPAVCAYREEFHQAGLQADQPVFSVRLNGMQAYHPYTHLQFLDMEEVDIKVGVQDLRTLRLHSSTGPLDDAGPFEILGASPKKGSFLLIGNDEIFAKRLDSLQIGWDFYGLPFDEKGTASYFASYPYGIDNQSFQLRISALSDHRFHPRPHEPAQLIPLFSAARKDSAVEDHRLIEDIDLSRLRIRHDVRIQPEDVEDYSNRKALGYLKLELAAPVIGFGHEVYAQVYNGAVNRSYNIKEAKNGVLPNIEMPKEPITPLAENLFVNYTASSRLYFAPALTAQNERDGHHAFFHLHPFGFRKIYSEGRVTGSGVIPRFDQEGSLFIGLKDVAPGMTINLLFELERNDKWSVGRRTELHWMYLSHDVWRPLKAERVLFDETNGLIHSGILSIELPEDMSDDNETMGPGTFWISAGAIQKAALVSRIKRIHTDAVTAVFQDDGSDPDHPISLPAGSAEELAKPIQGVLRILQPLATTGGRPQEDNTGFNQRVSEVLRHKNRAITAWDIERLLMRRFDWLAHVRAFGYAGHERFMQEGEVVVAALPTLRGEEVFYQPLLDPGQIMQMEQFLKELSSPFARITVRNPSYEYLWIKCKLQIDGVEIGATLKRLHEDLLRFICPWFYGQVRWAMNMPPFKRSEILNFIQTRSYIRFVTGFSVIRMIIDDDGKYQLLDSAREEEPDDIRPAYPWSIPVPLSNHQIEILSEPQFFAPERSSLEDLVIGSNLVLGDDSLPGDREEGETDQPEESSAEEDEGFWFTFKI